jgi:putative inorganic carbon (HCO3(-)) transporter
MIRMASSAGYGALLLALPLTGAVLANARPASLAWSLCVIATGVISLVFWWRLSRERGHAVERHITWLVMLAAAYVAFQLLPLPLWLLRWMSPQRAGLTEALGAVIPAPGFAPLSVEPAATMTALMTVTACALCFLVVREVTWRSLRAASWITVLPLIVLAVLEAGIALQQAMAGEEVAGTYWNRNHLAGFLEMVLPLAVVFAAHTIQRSPGDPNRLSGRRMLRSFIVGGVLPIAAIAIILLGVVASGSRLGFLSTIAGVVSLGLAFAVTRLEGRLRWVAIAMLPALALVLFVTLANRDVSLTLARYMDSTGDMTGENRLPIWADTLKLLAAFLLFGSGLGTYATAFIAFQTSGLSNHWTHAHNDYLEFATDLGLVGYVIFGALLLAVIWRALTLVRMPRRSGSDLVALGCLGGIAAIAVHSIGDFNLYMPANVFLLSWIAGIAAGVPPPADPSSARRQGDVFGRRLASGGRVFRPGRIVVTLSIVTLVLSSLAIAKTVRGDSTEPATVDARLDAVRKSPASPFLWLDLAEALNEAGRDAEAKASVARALALGPHVSVMVRRAATLADQLGDRRLAVSLISRELQQKGADPSEIFGWFVERGISNADVLAALSGGPATALTAFLRYLMAPGTCPDAASAWHELITRHRRDPKLAGDYVNFVSRDCNRPDDAAVAWAEYAKGVAPAYRETEWVFNGGFEMEPARVAFDWRWNERTREAEVDVDATEKSSGSRSLRMSFRGPSRATYEGATQQVIVTPGTYRFSAAVRTQELSSADGIFFHITGGDRASRVDVQSAQSTGTTSWHTINSEVIVPEGVSQIRIQIARRPGPRAAEEGDLKGTAWVDAVTLSKVG